MSEKVDAIKKQYEKKLKEINLLFEKAQNIQDPSEKTIEICKIIDMIRTLGE